MPSSRSLALEALERWRRGTEFADKIVADIFARTSLGPSDRAFVLELFYGVLRNLSLLDFWIAKLRSEPVNPSARDILRLGLYQVLLIETAAHAAVFETVELARPRTALLNQRNPAPRAPREGRPNEGGRQPAAADPLFHPGIPD